MKPKKRKFANDLKFTKHIYIWFKDQYCNVIGLDDEQVNNKVCLEDYFGAFLVLLVFGMSMTFMILATGMFFSDGSFSGGGLWCFHFWL